MTEAERPLSLSQRGTYAKWRDKKWQYEKITSTQILTCLVRGGGGPDTRRIAQSGEATADSGGQSRPQGCCYLCCYHSAALGPLFRWLGKNGVKQLCRGRAEVKRLTPPPPQEEEGSQHRGRSRRRSDPAVSPAQPQSWVQKLQPPKSHSVHRQLSFL